MSIIQTSIQTIIGTASELAEANPVLGIGQIAMDLPEGEGGKPDKFKIGNGIDTWSNLLYINSKSASSKTIFTSAQQVVIVDDTVSVFGSGIGSKTILANTAQQNQVYQVILRAFVSVNLPDNLLINFKLGSSVVATLILAAAILDTTNDEPIDIVFYIGIRTIGETGTVVATGECFNRLYDNHIIVGSATPTVIDFTENQTIDVVVTSQGSNSTWKTAIATIEQKN